jgi:hypothetical protein
MSELDMSGSVEGLERATSPVYSTTRKSLFLLASPPDRKCRKFWITPMRRYDKEEILSNQLSMG